MPALTYSDILAGPMLSFLNAVLAGGLPKNCATAALPTGASMAYDANASAKTAILFGGCCTSAAEVSGSTQSFSTTTGTWTPVKITGSVPVPRLSAAFGYDPTSGDLVLFGGEYLPGGMSGTKGTHVDGDKVLGDTWTWNGATSTWAQACTSCTVTPPAALGAAIAYHRGNVEDLLYGGYTDTSFPAAPATTWIWNGTWTAG